MAVLTSSTMRTSPKAQGRRVSFSDPDTKLRVYPGADENRDAVLFWILMAVAFFVRFYRLGIPHSVVFDEVRYSFAKIFDFESVSLISHRHCDDKVQGRPLMLTAHLTFRTCVLRFEVSFRNFCG